MRGKNFLATVLATVTVTIFGATVPTQAMTIQRSVPVRAETPAESVATTSSKPKKAVKAADWKNEDGKIYMPFTGEYVGAKYFNGLIKKLKSGVDILLLGDRPINAGGILNLCNIQLVTEKQDSTIIFRVTNVSSKEDLEAVRLYIRQTGKKWQLFADSLDDDIAYGEIIAGNGKIKAVEMTTEAGGAENLSKHQLMSASGALIGTDKGGDIKAGETVTITITMK